MCTGLLTCGDDEGGIWLYNIQKLVNQKTKSDEILEPSRVSVRHVLL